MGNAVEYDIFKTQIYDLIRLQSWYVWHVIHAENMNYSDIFEKPALVDFWYWSKFRPENMNENWDETKHWLFQKCKEHPADTDTSTLEEEIFSKVALFVNDSYLKQMYDHYLEQFAEASQFAGFSYNFREKPEQRIELHFTNCDVPDSPFKNKPRLIAGLLKILDAAHSERPEMTKISCGSWLNDLPLFRELFPPMWTDNITYDPVAAHGGWWQQLIDRKGAMHNRNEKHLRETGEFPFKCTRCGCPVSELREYLNSIMEAK